MKERNHRILKYSKPKIMNKAISLTLIIDSVILIAWSFQASDSIGSDFSRFFTGSPTDKSMWMLIGGAVAATIGASGLLFSGSKTP